MSKPLAHHLSRRERQIMDAIYSLGQASAVQVLDALPDPPGLSSVRKLILILEEKGHLRHVQEGQHFLYLPTHPRQAAAKSAMRQVLNTFFGGNLETAVATLLSEAETELTDEEAARLSAIIEGAKGGEREDRGNGSAACGTKGE
jgi:predicted transcriptional regulator